MEIDYLMESIYIVCVYERGGTLMTAARFMEKVVFGFLVAATIALFAGCSVSQGAPTQDYVADSKQAAFDRELDFVSYLAKNDNRDWGNYTLLLDDKEGLLVSFDPVDASVSNAIPAYDVTADGGLEPASWSYAPLYTGEKLVGFFLAEGVDGGWPVTVKGVTEEGADAVADFVERRGSIALVRDRDGFWMVAGGQVEKLSVDFGKWLIPVGLRDGSGSVLLEGLVEVDELGSIRHADLLGVEVTDLSYRHESDYLSGEMIYKALP